MRTYVTVVGIVAVFAAGAPAMLAQAQRPRVQVTPVAGSAPVRPGTTTTVSLKILMPKGVHVQSDKPRDPSLIPTVLTVTPPAGVIVERIVYPKSTDFVQAGRRRPLAVFGPDFTIDVRLSVATSVPAGDLAIPAQLRYQACNDSVCFPPARANAQWTVKIE